MAHERRRAALAALCVFAVALAAALFPAGGFGTHPSGVGTGGSPDAPPGDGAVPDRTTEPTTSSDSATDGSEGSDEPTTATTTTETSTPTPTTTETTESAAGDDPDEGRSLADVLVPLLGALALVAIAGFWTGVLGLTTTAVGPLPFTITLGGTPVGSVAGRIPSRTMALVVGLSATVPRLLDDAATLTREVGGGLATVVGGVARGTGSALRIGARGLGATFLAVPRALAGLGAGAGVLSGVGESLSFPNFGRRDGNRGRSGPRSSAEPEPEDPGPPSVEEAWRTMAERVRVPNRRARTPEEVARAAVERGFPDDAVRRLTDAFREVRYGGFSRSSRTETARSALDRLREYWRGDE